MRQIIPLAIMLMIGTAMCVSAQEIPAPLTEAAAVQLALKNSPMLRMAQAEAGMAQARIGMARSEGALQVSGNGQATASSMRSVLPVPGVMPQAFLQSQDRGSVDLNATAMLPLYTGGRISQSIRAAELSAAASQSQTAAVRTQVAQMARMGLADWRQALAMATVAQDTVTAQQRNAEVIQQFFDVGKVPRFDVLRAQAALAAAKQQQADAQAEVISARARLAQVLGVPVESLGAPVDEPIVAPPVNTVQTALTNRPDLRAAQQSIEAANAGVQARKSAYKPQVYAMGMVDAFSPSDMGKSTGYTLGVVAGIPLLDGGRRRAEVGEAQQAVAQAQAALDNVELQVRADVAVAEARVTAAGQNIDTAAAQVKSAEEAYTVAQARYSGGKSNIVELLDAQQALTEARQSVFSAQAKYRAALATLYQAMGIDALETPQSQGKPGG
ncbi:MAG: TolC family protein [Armatimonadota bacterium]